MKLVLTAAAAAILSALLGSPAAASTFSSGCAAVRGGATGLTGRTFSAGEVLTLTFTATGGAPGNFTYEFITPAVGNIFVGQLNGPTTTVRFAVTETVTLAEGVGSTGPTYALTANCATAVGDAASSSVASVSVAGATATAVTGQIGSRLSGLNRPGASASTSGVTGAAGAGATTPTGIWFNVDYTGVYDDFALTPVDGDIFTAVAGVDYQATDDVLVGVAATVSGADVDTDFNLGGVTSIMGGLAPYASVRVSDNITFSATAGYLYGRSSSDRRAGAVATGERVEGDFSTRTWLLAGSVGGFVNEGPAILSGRLGVNWTRSFVSDFTESDGTVVRSQEVTLGESLLELQPSWLIPTDSVTIEPYLLAQYSYRFMQTDIDTQGGQEHPNDRHGGELGAGLRLYGDQGLSGQIEGRRSIGWQDQTRTSLSGNIRLDF